MSGASRRARGGWSFDLALLVASLGVCVWTRGTSRAVAVAAALCSGALLLARAFGRGAGLEGAAARRALPSRAQLGVAALLCALVAFAGHALWTRRSRPPQAPYEPVKSAQLPAALQICLERPEVDAYVRDLHDEIIGAWVYPESVPPDQEVVLQFTLHESGQISDPVVASSTRPGLGQTALRALEQAAPLPPLDFRTRCLASMRVQVALSNPSQSR